MITAGSMSVYLALIDKALRRAQFIDVTSTDGLYIGCHIRIGDSPTVYTVSAIGNAKVELQEYERILL